MEKHDEKYYETKAKGGSVPVDDRHKSKSRKHEPREDSKENIRNNQGRPD